ncbi:MAG TPA: hypothetical protein PL124_08780 [Candidatus Cloacimonadota bacterium]|nr:hypothetical protein [Candidatus Cloacimonadota bacterium]
MGEESPEKKCNMCEAGILGRNATKKVMMSVPGALEEAVVMFHMTPLEVQEHCTNHEIQIDEDEGIYHSNDFYMDRMLKMIKRLDAWMKYLESHATDRESITLGLKLIKETRETVKDLAEFQGRLDRRGNVNVQIETLNAQYNELQQVIMTGLCAECQETVIKLLSTQQTKKPANCEDASVRILKSASLQS